MTTSDHSPVSQNLHTNSQPGEAGSAIARHLERQLASLDAVGFRSQPWSISEDSCVATSVPTIDVNWLIAQRDLPYLVQALPANLLYRSLMNHGVEDSLEVVEWIRGDALVRVLDYDLWTEGEFLGGVEQPSGERFLQWVRWWNEISPDFGAERLLELDEGLIVGCLTAVCEIIPVGLNRNQEELSDDYWVTPDNRFGLKIKTPDGGDFDLLHGFIHSLYKRDIRTAQAVLSHAAMLIREESVDEARRWRAGRLEDQGFLSADEARDMLRPKSQKQLKLLMETAVKTELKKMSSDVAATLLASDSAELEQFRDSLLKFVRSRDADEVAQEIEQTLGVHEIVRLVGTGAPQNDVLLQDEDVMDAFLDTVARQTQKTMLMLESQSARQVRARVQNNPEALLVDSVIAWLSEDNLALVADYKARLGRTSNAVAAALGAVGDQASLSRVLAAVRGCLNVGLERALAEPEQFFPENVFGTVDAGDESTLVAKAAALLKSCGPEALFQLGWQTLQELAADALQHTLYVVDKNEHLKAKIDPSFAIRLGDGESVRLAVPALLNGGRYGEVRRWLRQFESAMEPAVQHLLESTLNRLPVFPIVLMEEGSALRGSTAAKPYERLDEVRAARRFFERLGLLVGVTVRGE